MCPLSSTPPMHVPWSTVLPHRQPIPDDVPPEDEQVVVLPRHQYSALTHWVDDLPTKFDHLLHILANATDLARSSNGWVFLHSLKRYSGREIPGNVDSHTDTILHANTFSLSRSGQSLTLDRKCRFTLREASNSNGKLTFVIAASSQLPHTILEQSQPTFRQSRTNPSPTLSRPALPKFGVYFCQTKIFRNILLRDGIKPTLRTSSPSPAAIALKLHATDTHDISAGVLNSRLNHRQHPICLFINIPATFDADFTWVSLKHSVIGTPKVSLPPTFFHWAIDISGTTPVD